MTDRPFFSVIIPLYDRVDYVGRAIDCVLAQTDQDYEIIVVDDGSTDGGGDYAASRAVGRLTLISQANQGGAGAPARNTGMAQANGQWFAFLDADDFWHPNHLSELRELAEKCPRAGLIATTTKELREAQVTPQDDRASVEAGYCNYFINAAKKDSYIHVSSAAIQSRVFETVGAFGSWSSGPDLEYWVRVSLTYPVAVSARITTVYYRGNGGNMEKRAKTESRSRRKKFFNGLGDVSPSLGTIQKRAVSEPDLLARLDIRRYVNARLDRAIKMQFVQNNFNALADLQKLKFPPMTTESQTLDFLARMPLPVLAMMQRGRKAFRR